MGLSMVHGFITQSGGHMHISSRKSHGTSISLYFPCASHLTIEDTPPSDVASIEQAACRILVVEDEEEVRQIAVFHLRNAGYEVEEAANGKDAIQILESTDGFDVLFTDMVLPGSISGVLIGERAQAVNPDIKVILTTGYSEEALGEATNVRDTQLIKKPYTREDLLVAVSQAMEATHLLATR